MGKPEGKRPLGRPRHRCEDNIKMDLMEVGCDPGERIDLAEDRDQWRAYVHMFILRGSWLIFSKIFYVFDVVYVKSNRISWEFSGLNITATL